MAFSTHDQVPDSPTNVFATLNPLNTVSGTTLSEGNLKIVTDTTGQGYSIATLEANSGKFYVEYLALSTVTSVGVTSNGTESVRTNTNSSGVNGFSYFQDGNVIAHQSGTVHSNIGTYADGNVIGVYLNLDSAEVSFYKNNNLQGTITSLVGDSNYTFMFGDSTGSAGSTAYVNFGQDPTFGGNKSLSSTYPDANGIGSFYYQPPTGALALCTANLPDPDIDPAVDDLPEDYFKSVIWTGTGSDQNVDLEFNADLVWAKRRNGNDSHRLYDSIRGETKDLVTNSTASEGTNDYGLGFINSNTRLQITGSKYFGGGGGGNPDFVAWCFRAGGAPTADNSNTSGAMTANSVSVDGTLQSSYTPAGSPTIYPKRMSVNTKAGFSIVKWQASNGSDKTVPHGLSNSLDMIIMKNLDTGTYGWHTSHIGLTTNHNLLLNASDQSWNPSTGGWVEIGTGSVFNIKNGTNGTNTNNGTDNYIAYCWHSVAGYSKFGSYTTDVNNPPFVYLGFRPAFIMIKPIEYASEWNIVDNSRNEYNPTGKVLFANKTNQEYDYWSNLSGGVDILSNGFKTIGNGSNSWFNANTSGFKIIYAAFAEMPFKYATAR
jgi:hypothetical protein